ncbi:uncharacterized protein LOC113752884 [Coffea eugenioides]|uniref:uncharacterized protein LOC113752884 n=1 Tax=Coffea eugenioides TaxID=49369 RepID=UPI000F609B44|nr:uncharacterized protein LOC113752884 [Coffea eugenioides]XP_027152725.1 uncharacterized protein LOC113752884 [Coffea eugenioides]XP_027152726.1 uncharacterized protein LOC113752884 [Coffea eugenioides]
MVPTANTMMTSSAAFSICRSISPSSSSPTTSPTGVRPRFFRFPNHTTSIAYPLLFAAIYSPILTKLPTTRKLRSFVAAAEDETLVPEAEQQADEAASSTPPPPAATTDQTVSVTVSPSDILTMFFQAEGTMNETAIPTVTKALEETEGVADLKVQVLEGIASVELTKQTTVQATGVASNLVEVIQSKGFKLQTLNLSFQDEEDFS